MGSHWHHYVTIPDTKVEIGLVLEITNDYNASAPPTYRGTLWPWDYDRNRRASYREEDEWKSDILPTPGHAEMQITQQFYYGLLVAQHNRLYGTVEVYQKYLSELPPHALPQLELLKVNMLWAHYDRAGTKLLEIGETK